MVGFTPVVLVVCAAALLNGCTSHSASKDESASGVVASLGAVPIPTAPRTIATATASERSPTIVEMGAAVDASLPSGVRASVIGLGPEELTPEPGREHTVGVITVKLIAEHGSLSVRAADFSSRDETGKVVTLTPQGTDRVTASPGHPATLKVRGTYESGAAQMTWRHDGAVVAVWDFNIELD